MNKELKELIENFHNKLEEARDARSEVMDYIRVGAKAVGVGRNFYEDLSNAEITTRAKEILSKIKG